MKETEKLPETKAAGVGQSTPEPAAHRIRLAMPIIYKAPKKEGKRKYSQGLKEVQKLGRGWARGSERLADGMSRGFSTFRTRSNDSSRKKRDGAIVDAVKNYTKALRKSVQTASKAPNDVVKRANTKWASRQIRKAARPLFG